VGDGRLPLRQFEANNLSQKGRVPRHLKTPPQNCFREKREKLASLKNGRILRDARYPCGAATGFGIQEFYE